MDDIDRSIWTSIGLNNQLKTVSQQMWDAMTDGKTVTVLVDGQIIKEFHGRDLGV